MTATKVHDLAVVLNKVKSWMHLTTQGRTIYSASAVQDMMLELYADLTDYMNGEGDTDGVVRTET
jgi:hypothetical protein